jgi:hypothetical protein
MLTFLAYVTSHRRRFWRGGYERMVNSGFEFGTPSIVCQRWSWIGLYYLSLPTDRSCPKRKRTLGCAAGGGAAVGLFGFVASFFGSVAADEIRVALLP